MEKKVKPDKHHVWVQIACLYLYLMCIISTNE